MLVFVCFTSGFLRFRTGFGITSFMILMCCRVWVCWLSTFFLIVKRGYCEQFVGTMVVMVWLFGLLVWVVVGFMQGV